MSRIPAEAPARPATGQVVAVTALMVLAQAMLAVAMLGPAVLAPKAAVTLGVAPESIGVFITIAYAVAMGAGLAVGALVSRWGAMRVCQLTLAAAALGLALGGTGLLVAILAGAVAIGVGYGVVNPVASAILARMAPPERLGLVLSLKQTGVPAGGMLAGAILPSVALAFGWQAALLAAAFVCLAAALVCEPARARVDRFIARSPIAPPSEGGFFRAFAAPIRLVFAVPALRDVAMVSVAYSANQMMLFTFFVAYAHLELGHSLVSAGAIFSGVHGAGIFGRILWGVAGDRLRRPRWLLGLIGVGSGLTVLALAVFGQSLGTTGLAAGAVLIGLFAVGWNGLYFAEVVRAAPSDRVGLATGGAQFFTFFGALGGPAVGGVIVALTGSYSIAMACAAALVLVSGLALAWRSR